MYTFDHSTIPFMAEQEQQTNHVPDKHPRRTLPIVIAGLFILLIGSFLGVFLGFNYFGEKFLRNYLQEKIRIASYGLYHADFKAVQVNILTGRVVLDSFDLIPDSVQYERLKRSGKVPGALYRLSFTSVSIDRVHFRQIYARKRINFRRLTVHHPVLRIVGFRDTVTAGHSRWRVVYEDIYPAVSGVFNDFHVDSVMVDNGYFLSSSQPSGGRKTSGEYEFNAILRDVSVNKFSYYNHKRVFYSRDVDLIVHNVEYYLADSLYVLKAKELGFSLTGSVLYGKELALIPNVRSAKAGQAGSGDFYRLDLPAFSIRGIDLYRAMTSHEVEIQSVKLNDFRVRVYRNNPPAGKAARRKSGKKITLAGLYTVVAKDLQFVNIDSLSIKKAAFEFYPGVRDTKPELRIDEFNLELSQFRLDSVSYKDPDRIFYSRDLELTLDRISLNIRDDIHLVNASGISVSTRKSLVNVTQSIIFPGKQRNWLHQPVHQNTMYIRLPELTFTGIDLKKVFNNRILNFDRLIISEPEIRYIRSGPPKNPDPRFRKPQDFFEEENEDVVYDLLKKYLWIVKGREINITNGFGRFSRQADGKEIPIATGSFDLTMHEFLIDSVHGMNQQGYFYSNDFDLDLKELSIVSSDSLSHLHAGRVHIATPDSLIEAENIQFFKTADPMHFNTRQDKRQSLTFDFSLKKLQLTGLNHKKLFLEKVVKANSIVLEYPTLRLKSSNILHPEGPIQASQLLATENFIRTLEVGRCQIRKGSLFYDGQEDRKASYFSLKDIDFTLVNAGLQIPEKGKGNGVIKFDSLQLKVFPLRAVMADSTYVVEAQSLEVHSYPADITLKGIRVAPLYSGNSAQIARSRATITIPEIRLKSFYFDRAIFDNQWLLDELYVEHPDASFDIRQRKTTATGSSHFDPAGLVNFPPFMETVAVRKVSISNADAVVVIHQSDTTRSYSLKNMMIGVTRFRADSATRANPAGTPLFNAEDITFSAPGYSWISNDSMYTFRIGRFGLSTGSSFAYADSVTAIPNYSRADFAGKLGYQTDRLVVKIPRMTCTGLDFRKLVADRMLQVQRLDVDRLNFESYRDKRVPFPTWQRPPMPGHMAAEIKFPAIIDTIVFSDGFASYEEQVGDEPGKIFFDRMNGTLTGFITPSGSAFRPGNFDLDLHGTARLIGLAPVESWFNFRTGHPTDTFTVRAVIGELDLTAINPILSRLLPLAIKRGTATSTEIIQLNGNSTRAIGRLDFRFNNLVIDLLPAKPETLTPAEQALLEKVVNLLLADSNPNADGKMKQGVIYFERDPSKGIFNFLWKSVLSGLKSTLGFNTKAQKVIIKADKSRK
jgi:hypothetical protein